MTQAARPIVRQRQTALAFAPSDVATLLSLPDMEAKYRLLRNEWLTMHSRVQQAEEHVTQAERSGNRYAIEDARAERARIATELGVMKRLALLARVRAEAEIFHELACKMLPPEIKKAIHDMVEDILQRPNNEIVQMSSAKPTEDDYRFFDDLLSRWTLQPGEAA